MRDTRRCVSLTLETSNIRKFHLGTILLSLLLFDVLRNEIVKLVLSADCAFKLFASNHPSYIILI